MIVFALRVFATVVLFLLATSLLIHTKETQWAYGAGAAFVASFLLAEDWVARRVP